MTLGDGRPRPARLLPDDADGRAAAIDALRAGGLVAMPTDTVYGVGVALSAEQGLERLFAAKDRPLDRAIVLLVADADQAASVGVLSPAARALAARFWPGGLTLVLSQVAGAGLPSELTAGPIALGIAVGLIKMLLIGQVLAVVDASIAKARFLEMPDLLGLASLLALAGLAIRVLLP